MFDCPLFGVLDICGTFAKKIILKYIEEYTDDEFMANLRKIAEIADKFLEK